MKEMAMAAAMSQHPPPPPSGARRPPPPPPPRGKGRSNGSMAGTKRSAALPPQGNGNKVARTTGSARKAPPPPPMRNRGMKPPPPPKGKSMGTNMNVRKRMSIRKPVVLRDVTVFQKKYQVGQGTYGSVFVGADKVTGGIVALKRINTEQEENGFPITALREVKILKALNHENVVKLKEIVTSKEQNEIPKNVFMVFEYHEYDLTGILETSEIRFTQDHIKSWTMQLLKGVNYMHINQIIHRDLKASNLLISRKGELRIADWGLARSWNPTMKNLTNGVVTLWYRPIELLLGCKRYSPKIDMWSVGCIVAEMFRRSGLLKGHNDASQLSLIFDTCGQPTPESWPNINEMCPLWRNHTPRTDEPIKPNRLKHVLKERLPYPSWMTPNAISLISNLLTLNPGKRWSALEAINADYFYDEPIVKRADELNMKFGVDSIHELGARKKHEQRRMQANGFKK